MNTNRQLKWDGCNNVRDLGGLPAYDGRKTRWGALVRSDDPSKLTAKGWEALWAHGIRTIITLCTEGKTEYEFDLEVIPSGIELVSVAIEDLGDTEFLHTWAATDLWCTPLYYQDALTRWPAQHAAVVAAFAQAQPSGVLFHCVRGCDRTGIIALLLLALVGVSEEDIVADYELSIDPERDEILSTNGTTTRKVILDTLAGIDAESYLLSAGLSQTDIDNARERFLE
ncbi:MAG: tyrosine-protein phosphatase [Anaerolineales bacterium]|jgi:protein tyrosine/serine phosphatase